MPRQLSLAWTKLSWQCVRVAKLPNIGAMLNSNALSPPRHTASDDRPFCRLLGAACVTETLNLGVWHFHYHQRAQHRTGAGRMVPHWCANTPPQDGPQVCSAGLPQWLCGTLARRANPRSCKASLDADAAHGFRHCRLGSEIPRSGGTCLEGRHGDVQHRLL